MERRTGRAWLRRLGVTLTLLLVSCATATALRAPVCLPFDYLCNLGAAIDAPALQLPLDGKVRVVFCQHGLWLSLIHI